MNNERLMVMRNKIENVGLEDCGVDGGLVVEIIDELIDSRFKIESLSAERDELIGLLKWLATSKVDGLSVMATLLAESHYGNTEARRILEIVEGK